MHTDVRRRTGAAESIESVACTRCSPYGRPLEVCPTSNIRTGVAQEWDDHPVHRLIAAGANVTINSDDPALFNCSLADEFRVLSRYQKRSMEDLTIAAVEASWLDEPDRQVLSERVRAWWGGDQSPVSNLQ